MRSITDSLTRIVGAFALLVGAVLAGGVHAEPWSIYRNCNSTPCTIGVALPGTAQTGWSEVATFSGPQEAWAVACAFHDNDSSLFSPDVASGAVDCGALQPAPNGMIAISAEHWSIFRNCNTRPCTIGVALPTYSEPDFSRIATYGSAEQAWAEACDLHFNDPNYNAPDIVSGLIDCGLLSIGNNALLGPWYFGRVNGPLLCELTLTGTRAGFGYLISGCNPNESFWALRGQDLDFFRNDGFVTTRFRRQRPDYWVGDYLGDPAADIVHYLSRTPLAADGSECNTDTYNPYGCN